MRRSATLCVIASAALAACSGRPVGDRNATPTPNPFTSVATAVAANPTVVAKPTAMPVATPAPAKSRLTCPTGTNAVSQWAFEVGANVPAYFCTSSTGEQNGPFIVLYPGGATAITGTQQTDELHGAWHRFAADGTELESGVFDHGSKDGVWQQWSTTGALLGSYTMAHGTGVERLWSDDGRLIRERTLVDGIADGPASTFGPTGTPLITENFKHGVLDGPRTVGDKTVLRIDDKWRDGVRTGDRKMWRRGILLQQDGFDNKGRHHGKFMFWRDRKTFRDAGAYEHGRRVGEWKWFDSGGNVERIGGYVDGRRDGAWREMKDARTTWTGQYKSGRPDGTFTFFDYRGNIVGSFDMKDGTGTMLRFSSPKKVERKFEYVDGKPDGLYQELSTQGKVVLEGHYHAGKKHGAWIEKTAGGSWILGCEYARDKLTGDYRKYIGGKISVKARYGTGKQAGLRHGEYQEFTGDTVTVQGQFADDLKTGTWNSYDSAGTLTSSSTWNAGVLDGPWQEFANGKPAVTGLYRAGMRTGTWSWFDGNGTVVREVQHKAP